MVTAFGQERQELTFEHQFIYRLVYQSDSTDRSSLKHKDMELLTNGEVSLFQAIDKGQRDSAFLAQKKVQMAMMYFRPVNKFSYQILKTDNWVKTYDSPFGINLQGIDRIYFYEEPREQLQWQISDDTMRIANMYCQQATTSFGGRDWVAWFAPDIPVPDGPYKFCGLPGLIIAIEDTKAHWRFELTNIRNEEKKVVLNFQSWYEFVPASKERLLKERRKFQDNLVASKIAAGSRFDNSPNPEMTHEKVVQKIDQMMVDDNNWIELEP